jgi:imidazolonepropionase-like amidohydrolase
MDEKYNKKMQLSPYILAGWLLNGSAGPILKEVLLEIKNDRIAAIRGGMEKEFAGGDFLDLSDYTLLPGLVDCHAHLSMCGSSDPSVRERKLMPGSPATFLAVRAKPERLLEALRFPERVTFKGIPISSLSSEGRRES